ncbi:hypothetical protein [Zavarzinia sp.]|uniref:hypothetical protein n=1 Tax=Zavarzinia sp. TaxID=2027920 RepID=UPI0035645427
MSRLLVLALVFALAAMPEARARDLAPEPAAEEPPADGDQTETASPEAQPAEAPAEQEQVQGPAWRTNCAPTSAIVEGKVMPATACAARLSVPGEGGDASLTFWTEALDAEGVARRPAAVAFDFPVPDDRRKALNARFSGNAAVLGASAAYSLSFNDGPPENGRCRRLIIPPRPSAPSPAGPQALSFDRMGCMIEDADGNLRRRILERGAVHAGVTVAGVTLGAGFVLAAGGEDAVAAATARLNGTPPPPPEAEEPAAPALTPGSAR